jgi:hypothetical protein
VTRNKLSTVASMLGQTYLASDLWAIVEMYRQTQAPATTTGDSIPASGTNSSPPPSVSASASASASAPGSASASASAFAHRAGSKPALFEVTDGQDDRVCYVLYPRPRYWAIKDTTAALYDKDLANLAAEPKTEKRWVVGNLISYHHHHHYIILWWPQHVTPTCMRWGRPRTCEASQDNYILLLS